MYALTLPSLSSAVAAVAAVTGAPRCFPHHYLPTLTGSRFS